MHILAAFVIVVCLFAGFHPVNPLQDNEMYVDVGVGAPVIIRQQVTPLNEFQFKHITKQSYDYSCGSAALATLLNSYLGENFSERQVIQGLMDLGSKAKIAERRAFSLLDMKKFVSTLGYAANGYKAELSDLSTLGKPCILPIEFLGYRHFTVFRGIHGNHIFLADPYRGNTSYTLSAFKDMWFENVIFVVDRTNANVPNKMRLSNDDLRYINENTVLDILTDYGPNIPDLDELILPDEYHKYIRD
ncbi:MAG: C39 family peptidase [Desulfosalsimonadaceae bacterium]|nr:C39 family peptidase [Desulfosalsimonadaceae bacterium]